MFDQIYWVLRADGIAHENPISLRPEMKKYTIFVDGISKSLAREWEDDYVVEDTAPFHSDVKIKKHFGVES